MNNWLRQSIVHAVGFFVAATLALASYEFVIKPQAVTSAPREGLYGAFLTNGQVYFGVIERDFGDRVVLVNVFYPKARSGAVAEPSQQDDLQLIKLGNELYAPEDRIEINAKQLLYLAKLKDDGKVGKAIREYKR
ncbi:MAG TPA: hypothetical protein VN397_00485 [Candidatus Methylomirabilis sp.]|nr:hypothetical protein [Candidatus Methylomirabilis sp.]